jgi:hypothetical protein
MATDANKIAHVVGLEFHHPRTYDSYALSNRCSQPLGRTLRQDWDRVFAGDIFGNAYLQADAGAVYMWDHETDQLDPSPRHGKTS